MKKRILKKSFTMPKKLKRGYTLGFFKIRSVGKLKKLKGGPFGEIFFRKKVSPSRKYSKAVEYPLVPLSFLDDVKILFRKLLRQFFKFAK